MNLKQRYNGHISSDRLVIFCLFGAVNWWLCSPRSGFTTNFCNVSSNGNAGINNASLSLGVVLGFRTYFIFLNNSFFFLFFSFGDKGNRKEKVTIINCN